MHHHHCELCHSLKMSGEWSGGIAVWYPVTQEVYGVLDEASATCCRVAAHAGKKSAGGEAAVSQVVLQVRFCDVTLCGLLVT